MRTLLRSLRDTTGTQLTYLYIYMAGFFWALSYTIYTPEVAIDVVSEVGVLTLTVYTMVASVLGAVGILKRNNLLVERLGVTLLMFTPLIYAFLQIGIMIFEAISPAPDMPALRISAVFLGVWIFIPLNQRRRDLKSRVSDAKTTPIDR